MLKRKLIYTGITRAKKTLLLIGDPTAMQYGIRRIEIERRTILKEEIKKYLHATSIKQELSKLDSLDVSLDELGVIETFIDEDDFSI